MLDLLKIQKTGKHNYKKIENEIIIDLKQAHDAYCNYKSNATHTSNCKRFWSYVCILRIFGMTFQT